MKHGWEEFREAYRLAKRDLPGEAGEEAVSVGLHLLFRCVLRGMALGGGEVGPANRAVGRVHAGCPGCCRACCLLLVLVCTCLMKPGGLAFLDSMGLGTYRGGVSQGMVSSICWSTTAQQRPVP